MKFGSWRPTISEVSCTIQIVLLFYHTTFKLLLSHGHKPQRTSLHVPEQKFVKGIYSWLNGLFRTVKIHWTNLPWICVYNLQSLTNTWWVAKWDSPSTLLRISTLACRWRSTVLFIFTVDWTHANRRCKVRGQKLWNIAKHFKNVPSKKVSAATRKKLYHLQTNKKQGDGR